MTTNGTVRRGTGAATLRFLGAAGTVTGSRFLVTTPAGARVLVDCGMYQGRRELRRRNWAPFPEQVLA